MIFNEIAERELDTVDDELLSLLSHELGQILDWKKLCSGVYSLNVQLNPDSEYSCGEFYLVLEGAPISQEARALGRPIRGASALLYPIDPPDEGAWTAIMYELCKKQLAHGIPAMEGWTLTDAAMEGMELCPAYFGPFPVPPHTPWGWTLRHKLLDNGIYWMETDQYTEVLALNGAIQAQAGYSLYDAQLAVAEATKRQLDRKKTALILAPSHVTGKWA